MKKLLLLLFLLSSIQGLFAQANLPQKSAKASVTYRLGLTDISIQYSAPAVRGRQIWGGIVPYDKVWRAGANNATNITFSTAVKMEGKTLPAGTYAFFLIPRKNQGWTAIFNSDAKQWGAFIYNETKDALRVGVRVENLESPLEHLAYQIEEKALEEGEIRLLWDNKKVSLRFRVDFVPQAIARYDSLIGKAELAQKWFYQAEAADLLAEAGKMDEAKKYLDESLKAGPHVWSTWKLAQWQAKRGDYIGAFASTEKIRNLAKDNKEEKGVFGALEMDIVETEKRWKAKQAELLAAKNAQRDINRDIWTPFSEAYASNDAAKYIALHAKDFIRASGGGKNSLDLAGYADEVEQSFAWTAENGGRVSIEFRFFERLASATTASERGFYKYTHYPKEGTPRSFYGKFHVMLRKENGVWKIATDYDSNEGGTVGEADYKAAYAVDDFSKF